MKFLLPAMIAALLTSGCSATWSGVQEDSGNAWDWTKGKVNSGATYVKDKTE